MSNFNEMDYSEKIVAFLDGELDPVETESLFLNLASNPQLQEEMRQQVLISNSLKNSLIIPPDELKFKIFGAIGADTLATTGNASSSFFSKILNNRITLVLSSLAILFLVSFLYTFNEYQDLKKSIANLKNNETVLVNKNDIPIVSSVESENSSSQSFKSLPPMKQTILNERVETLTNSLTDYNELNNLKNSTNSYLYNFNTMIDGSEIVNQNNSWKIKEGKFLSQILPNLPYKSNFLDNLSMQIRFFEAKNFTNSNIKPINEPLLNNFGFALIYDLNKNHSIGVEIGQENFEQKFKGEVNDFPVLFKQNYTAFWAGVSYQYNFSQYNLINPYIRFLVGGTRVGPISKFTIGGKYNLTNKVAIFGGIENTGLFYEFQNNWNSSFKSGISTGLSIKF